MITLLSTTLAPLVSSKMGNSDKALKRTKLLVTPEVFDLFLKGFGEMEHLIELYDILTSQNYNSSLFLGRLVHSVS